MEVKMEQTAISCLEPALLERQDQEQTQEIRLSEGMPDIGSILAAWGQPILRSKEWRGREVTASAGMMVWVLYAPEDGGAERWLDTWVPFQLKWTLPEDCPEGTVRLRLWTRFVDARSVAPRKILVRCGLAAYAEGYVPLEATLLSPQEVPEDTRLLKTTYPLLLPKEVGEKTFLLDEEIQPPQTLSKPEELVYYSLDPIVTEGKVLTDKAVFRGGGRLHVLYRGADGLLHGYDRELPFSQYAELAGEHGSEAQADFALVPTSLELEVLEDGTLRLKAGIVSQYLIYDRVPVEVVEDAYSLSRELTLGREGLRLPAVLDQRELRLRAEADTPGAGGNVVEARLMPDLPRLRREGEGLSLEQSAAVQVLSYGDDGRLRASAARWEGESALPGAPENTVLAFPALPEEPQATPAGDGVQVRGPVAIGLTALAWQELPMVAALEAGDPVKPDPGRPSLVLRRRGEDRLWDIAKENRTTVEDIRRINALEGEPDPARMLIIPVG